MNLSCYKLYTRFANTREVYKEHARGKYFLTIAVTVVLLFCVLYPDNRSCAYLKGCTEKGPK